MKISSLVFACLCAVPFRAFGGGFSVMPVRIEISGRQTASMLTVENPSPQKRSYQVTVVDWDQNDGVDSYERAKTVFAVPPLFSIQAGGRQIVRIGLTRSAAPTERCYRIMVQELPLPMYADPGNVEIQTLLRVSVPLFVAGLGAGANRTHDPAALRWTSVDGSPDAKPGACFLIENTGTRHVQIQRLRWQGLSRPVTLGAYYLLPRRKRELCLPEASAGSVVPSGLIATTDHGEFPYEVVRKPQ